MFLHQLNQVDTKIKGKPIEQDVSIFLSFYYLFKLPENIIYY